MGKVKKKGGQTTVPSVRGRGERVVVWVAARGICMSCDWHVV